MKGPGKIAGAFYQFTERAGPKGLAPFLIELVSKRSFLGKLTNDRIGVFSDLLDPILKRPNKLAFGALNDAHRANYLFPSRIRGGD
jgi:hypothetical protein